jgi:predicted lipoprotein with Yx(FWY)xxD motif
LAVLLLAGCTSGGAVQPPAPDTPVPAGLFVVTDTAGRPMVIDGRGFVVYRFDGDSADAARSACVAECAQRWPPVAWSAQLRLVGVDRQLVGRLNRSDGTVQLTLAGWPLYGYSGDRMPGDVTGVGLDGKWWPVGPRGERLG